LWILRSNYKTQNAGQTWTSITEAQTEHFYDLAIIDGNTFFVSGADGTIYKTENAGQNWSSQNSGTTAWIYGIEFANQNVGIGVCHNGTIIKTENGGETWNTITAGITTKVNDVKFYNSDTVFCCGQSGKIYFSNDAGESWTNKPTGTNRELSRMLFQGDTLYAVGTSGTVLKSEDFGETWTVDETNTLRDLYAVTQNSTGAIYACGQNATIISKNAPIVSSICNYTHNFSIYPNPASETINITADHLTSIQIYDLNGRIVFSQQNISGDSFIANISFLNNGIWFCKVESKSGTSVSKFVKL
jgi:photosystem II stability/assembly factor-like uncharacterized protein